MPLAVGAGLLALVVGILVFRLGIRPAIRLACGPEHALADKAIRRLSVSYRVALVAVALRAGRMPLEAPPGAFDRVLESLLPPVLFVFAVEALRVGILDVYLAGRRRRPLPALVRDLATWLAYACGGLFLAGFVYRIDVRPVVFVSGMFSIVLGLALRTVLADLFAGVSLALDPPFRLGDWVVLSDVRRARVVEMTWRCVHLLTAYGETVIMPNSRVARTLVRNESLPTLRLRRELRGLVDRDVPPAAVAAIHEQALAGARERLLSRGMSMDPVPLPGPRSLPPGPAPSAAVPGGATPAAPAGMPTAAAAYPLRYDIDDPAHAKVADWTVAEAFWYGTQQRHLSPPRPVRALVRTEFEPRRERFGRRKVEILGHVDFLAALTPAEREELAGVARLAPYTRAQYVFRQGAPGDRLFIVAGGAVELLLEGAEAPTHLATLGAGQVFGEMALLTGEPRGATARTATACEILAIGKRDVDLLFRRRPEIVGEISRIVGERRARTAAAVEAPAARPEPADTAQDPAGELSRRIRAFFRLA